MDMLEAKPLPKIKYQTFTPDTKAHMARVLFLKKYGYDPDQIFFFNRLVWAGPVREAK